MYSLLRTLLRLFSQLHKAKQGIAPDANQWWKFFKVNDRGSLPVAEWSVFAREAAQFAGRPGCRPFREHNALFADLYTELGKNGRGEISDFGFGSQEPSVRDFVAARPVYQTVLFSVLTP